MKTKNALKKIALLSCLSLPFVANAQSVITVLNDSGAITLLTSTLPAREGLQFASGELLPLATSLLGGTILNDQTGSIAGALVGPLLDASGELERLTTVTDLLVLPGL